MARRCQLTPPDRLSQDFCRFLVHVCGWVHAVEKQEFVLGLNIAGRAGWRVQAGIGGVGDAEMPRLDPYGGKDGVDVEHRDLGAGLLAKLSSLLKKRKIVR